MGVRGVPPKPSRLKLLEGNPGKRAIYKTREPRPNLAAPSCPPWLDREARAEWRRVTAELKALGMLVRLDRSTLAAYCATWSQWREAFLFLREHGTSFLKDGVPTAYPEAKREEALRSQLLTYAREWGMTASARARLATPELPTADPLDIALGRA